jgi:RNA polymerase sigma-70 factor (ECF subfamily)
MSHPFLELWFRAEDNANGDRGMAERRPRLVREKRAPETIDDATIIERVRTGDERSFDDLYSSTFRELWSLARRYVGDAVAEEIVQDVFLRVWERRAGWVVRSTVRAYLFGAVRNHALHYLEHVAVEERASAATIAARRNDHVHPAEDGNDMFDAVARAVAALPERQRAAIVLRVQRGLTHAELGEALGVSAAAAGVLVRKAEAKLRIMLASYLAEG